MAGRKREYETIYILRPDITNEVIGQVNLKIRGVVEAGGGTLLKVENWGKRKLAYEVQKQMRDLPLLLVLGAAGCRRGRAQPAPDRHGHPLLLGEDGRERRPRDAHERADRRVVRQAATPDPTKRRFATGQANIRAVFAEDEEGAFDFEERCSAPSTTRSARED